MTRLTKYHRERMAKILLTHRFKQAGEALCASSARLFELVYDDQYDAETQRLMAKLQKLHRGAFSNTDYLRVNCAGMRLEIGNVAIGQGDVKFKSAAVKPRPIFSSANITYLDCELAQRLKQQAEAERQLGSDIAQARRECMATLGSFSTDRQLAEAWPEAMPLIGGVIPEFTPGTNLPAVQIARLNQAFGLPPVEAEAAVS